MGLTHDSCPGCIARDAPMIARGYSTPEDARIHNDALYGVRTHLFGKCFPVELFLGLSVLSWPAVAYFTVVGMNWMFG